ncbi:twin-arginine translocase TatA/TatE family subunit [Nonomuraea sp. NPDC005983]|uniref:twin-arginine translocase TatA/TatE family subunit n=1 Tax=Nonomuraea sp. NPDC005983 TaxID=3155595 RepID=UPI0033A7F480
MVPSNQYRSRARHVIRTAYTSAVEHGPKSSPCESMAIPFREIAGRPTGKRRGRPGSKRAAHRPPGPGGAFGADKPHMARSVGRSLRVFKAETAKLRDDESAPAMSIAEQALRLEAEAAPFAPRPHVTPLSLPSPRRSPVSREIVLAS